MSHPKPRDPLDALQSLIDDVLIQTGKALRASRKDASGHLIQTPEIAPPKLPETMRQYHSALDSLEFEILRAKSVLLRDLNQIQERKKLFIKPDPQPVEPQSKLALDLDTPSPPVIKDEPLAPEQEAQRPLMAPFPNMSIDLPADTAPMDIAAKGAGPQAQTQPQPAPVPMSLDPPGGIPDPRPTTGPLGMPSPLMADTDFKMDLSHGAAGMPGSSGMNFTDMEFSLAPPLSLSVDSQPLAAAAAAGGRHDALLGMMGANVNPSVNVNPDPSVAPVLDALQQSRSLNTANPSAQQEKVEDKTGEAADPSASVSAAAAAASSSSSSSKFHDLFGNGSGAADGMDFDFSLGGGEETFNDMMNDRGATFGFQMDGIGGPPTASTSTATMNNRSAPRPHPPHLQPPTSSSSSSAAAAAAAATTTPTTTATTATTISAPPTTISPSSFGGERSSSNAIVNNGGLSSSEFDAMILGLGDPDGP